MKIKIETTKKGFPAIWESGGGMTNTGNAQLVASTEGTPKTPIYIRRRGPLACEEHALFILEEGDVVIQSDHHRKKFNHVIYRVVEIEEENGELYAVLETLAEYSFGEWDNDEVADSYSAAINAAESKAMEYHCREPYYFLPAGYEVADEKLATHMLINGHVIYGNFIEDGVYLCPTETREGDKVS